MHHPQNTLILCEHIKSLAGSKHTHQAVDLPLYHYKFSLPASLVCRSGLEPLFCPHSAHTNPEKGAKISQLACWGNQKEFREAYYWYNCLSLVSWCDSPTSKAPVDGCINLACILCFVSRRYNSSLPIISASEGGTKCTILCIHREPCIVGTRGMERTATYSFLKTLLI